MERENGWYFVQSKFGGGWQPAYWNGEEWQGSVMRDWPSMWEDNTADKSWIKKVDESRIPDPDEENPMTIRP